MKLEVSIYKKLRDFELDAAFETDHGCMGIMGPSGSGKSMLLKCIAGVETPDRGRIFLNDRVLFDSERKINLPPRKRRVGYLFQNYALFPNMTVEKNIMAGLVAAGLKRQEIQVKTAEMIERFRLKGLEKTYPACLSGGQKQRTALARMLACEPEVLLFDEPFSAIDEELKEELHTELAALLEKYQRPSVLVSHDGREVERLCLNVRRIKEGKM